MNALEMQNTKGTHEVPKGLALAIDRAYHTSGRGGFGWVITRNGKVIDSKGSFCGYPQTDLLNALKSHSGGKHLYLSTPPNSPFINTQELLNVAEKNGVNAIHYPLCEGLEKAYQSSNDLNGNIPIYSYNIGGLSNLINFGPYTLNKKRRPWITCITAADLSGKGVGLENFFEEFGAKFYIEKVIRESHTLVLQKGYVSHNYQVETNSSGAEILRYNIDSIEQLNNALREQFLLQNSTLTILADTQFAKALIEANLVDEIIYHINISSTTDTDNFPPSRPQLPPLTDWEIASCTHFSKSCRLKIRNNPF